MGEYAKYNGREIKIGTCENMYYLRAGQRHMVQHMPGNVNPVTDAASIRFRFPFPDEDSIQPGGFQDAFRAIPIWGIPVPDGVKHDSVQLFRPKGYLLSIPCPEGPDCTAKVHRNGFGGAVKLSQQRYFNGLWVIVCDCGGCGAKWRYETLEQAQPIIDYCREEAKAKKSDWWSTIADRIEAGYQTRARDVALSK